ncbi:hypothetical protein [Kluyvera ascorbata]
MSKVEAEWTIELNVDCPQCGHTFDLTRTDDFWHGIDEAGEHGTAATKDFECCCPECEHEFTCDFVY